MKPGWGEGEPIPGTNPGDWRPGQNPKPTPIGTATVSPWGSNNTWGEGEPTPGTNPGDWRPGQTPKPTPIGTATVNSPWETGNYDPRTQGNWTPQGGWGAMGYDPNFRFANPDTEMDDTARAQLGYMNWVHQMLPYLLPKDRMSAITTLQNSPDFLDLPEEQRQYLNRLADMGTQFGVGQWQENIPQYDTRARLEAIRRANTNYYTQEGGTNAAGQPVGEGEWNQEGRQIDNLIGQLLASYGQGNMSRRGRTAYYDSIGTMSGMLPKEYSDILKLLVTPSYNTAKFIAPTGSMGALSGTTQRGYSQANPWG